MTHFKSRPSGLSLAGQACKSPAHWGKSSPYWF